jgi:CubicO group peptidase (beta-lactamase class C family)
MNLLTATRIGRYVLWNRPTNNDHRRFPSIALLPSARPFAFEPAERPAVFGPITTRSRRGPVSAPLEAVLDETGTTALVVVAKGRLVYEHYANGGARAAINRCFSVTKSLTSALIGIAVGDGRVSSIDAPISTFLQELAGRPTGGLTLRHLMEMRSGIRYVAGPLPWQDDAICYYSPECRAAALRAPVTDPVGRYFHYNDYHLFLTGMILERVMGEPLADFFERRLWQPIGAAFPASLSIDSRRHACVHLESGLNATALDLAKFGALYLNGGQWRGKQIVPAEWVRASTGPEGARRDPEWFSYYDRLPWGRVFAAGKTYYRHFWWGHEASPDEHDFFAMGALGQHIYVSPKHQVVIVRLSQRFPKGMWWPPVFRQMIEQLAQG